LYIFGPHQPLPQDIEETCSNYSGESPVNRPRRHDFFRSLLKIAKGVDAVGRFAAPVAIAGDVIQVGSAYHQDGNSIGRHTVDALASSAGGWAGAAMGGEAGAEIGAAVGSIVPGAGTVVGGVVGGIVGGAAGELVGSKAAASAVHAVEDVDVSAAKGASAAYHRISSWL